MNAIRWRTFLRNLTKFLRRTLKFVLVLGALVAVAYYLTRRNATEKKSDVAQETSHEPVSNDSNSVSVINNAIDAGRYDFAKQEIENRLRKNPDDTQMRQVQSSLMNQLQLDFKFNYLPSAGAVATHDISGEIALTSKDPYFLVLQTNDQCFLYVLQIRSSTTVVTLFPNSKFTSLTNPVPKGNIRIPEGIESIYLDNIPGTETIYLLASRWRQKKLENLIAGLKSTSDRNIKERVMADIQDYLQYIEQVTDSVPGLAFASYQFQHEVMSQ